MFDVSAVTVESNLARIEKVDLVKLGYQGAEMERIHRNSDESLRKVRQCTVEFHEFCLPSISTTDVAREMHRMNQLG